MDREASSFRIPVARAGDGRLIAPADARRGGAYRCPECDDAVVLHAGARKRRHFHHRSAQCDGETVTHRAAKALVAQAVEDWLAGGPPVVLDRRCAAEGCASRTRQHVPKKVAGVALERALPSGRVADVVLLARGVQLPVCVIEIRVTHAVDADKALAIGVPWIEVDGAQVCADAGRVLVAQRDKLVPWLCAEHRDTRGKDARAERELRRILAARVRALPFGLAEFAGYRVAGPARCVRGHDTVAFAWEGRHPPWPRPPCVIAVESEHAWNAAAGRGRRVLRRYVSVCTVCGERLAGERPA